MFGQRASADVIKLRGGRTGLGGPRRWTWGHSDKQERKPRADWDRDAATPLPGKGVAGLRPRQVREGARGPFLGAPGESVAPRHPEAGRDPLEPRGDTSPASEVIRVC